MWYRNVIWYNSFTCYNRKLMFTNVTIQEFLLEEVQFQFNYSTLFSKNLFSVILNLFI